MKKMKMKKVLIAVLTMAMIMGSSTMAFAAEVSPGEGTGEGETNVVKDPDVFTVVVPTDGGNQFDYILDPEGVIKDTNAARYGNKSFEPDKTMYFLNTDKDVTNAETPYHYSSMSKDITAINKSTKKVHITAKATVPDTNTVTMADAATVGSANDAQLYLALQKVKKESNKRPVLEGTAEEINVTLAELGADIPAKAGAYEKKWNGSEYTMQLKPGMENSQFESYSFCLTGACSESETAWKTIDDNDLPDVTVTWTVTGDGKNVPDEPEETADKAPSIATTSYNYTANNALEIPVDLGAGKLAATGITSITYTNNGTESAVPDTRWSFSNGKLVFTKEYCAGLAGKSLTRAHKITFNDKNGTSCTVTLKPGA